MIEIKNENPICEYYMENDIKNGYYEEYFTNSNKVKIRGRFKNGKKEGEWEYLDRSGRVYKTVIFEDGQNISGVSEDDIETETKKKELTKPKKYQGKEREEFIILNGEEVYIDKNGNIIRE